MVGRNKKTFFCAQRKKSVDNVILLCYSNSCLSRRYGGVAQLARARGSYPRCHRFKSSRRYHRGREETLSRIPTGFSFPRPVGQEVKTRPFHGCNMGSIPVRVTIEKRIPFRYPFFLSYGDSYEESHPAHIPTTAVIPTKQGSMLYPAQYYVAVRYGFETLLRRFRVGSLVGRSKFPYHQHHKRHS